MLGGRGCSGLPVNRTPFTDPWWPHLACTLMAWHARPFMLLPSLGSCLLPLMQLESHVGMPRLRQLAAGQLKLPLSEQVPLPAVVRGLGFCRGFRVF
jgi:hypothetical protein